MPHATPKALALAAFLLLCPAAAASDDDCAPHVAYEHPLVEETVPKGLVPHVAHHDPFVAEACEAVDPVLSGEVLDDAGDLVPHVAHHDPFTGEILATVAWLLSSEAVPDTLAFVEENRPRVSHHHPVP